MTREKWGSKPFSYQLLNIASELNRAKHWIKENESDNLRHSLERALELIDLTVSSNQGQRPLRDLLRLREGFSSFYVDTSQEYAQFAALLKNFLTLDPDVIKMGLCTDESARRSFGGLGGLGDED